MAVQNNKAEGTVLLEMKHVKKSFDKSGVLKDISQLKKDATPIDASNPHGKKQKAGKFTSVAKFGYYFKDCYCKN